MIAALLEKMKWPAAELDKKIAEQLAIKAALATRAALNEVPMLDALLDGEEVELTMTLQLRKKAK